MLTSPRVHQISTVRSRLQQNTLKGRLKSVRQQAKQYIAKTEVSDQESEDLDEINDRVIETQNSFIQVSPEFVSLTSPTFGDTIRIKNPSVKFGSSQSAFKELKHVEE